MLWTTERFEERNYSYFQCFRQSSLSLLQCLRKLMKIQRHLQERLIIFPKDRNMATLVEEQWIKGNTREKWQMEENHLKGFSEEQSCIRSYDKNPGPSHTVYTKISEHSALLFQKHREEDNNIILRNLKEKSAKKFVGNVWAYARTKYEIKKCCLKRSRNLS